MKIEAYFLDKRGNVVKKVSGNYNKEKKTFEYKEIFGIFKPVEIPCDLEQTIDFKGVKIAFFDTDNKQISLNKISTGFDLSSYIKNLKIGILTEELILERPKGLEDIIPLVAMVVLGAMLLVGYYSIRDIRDSILARFNALNKSVDAFMYNQQILLNMTKQLNNIYNKYCTGGGVYGR